MAEDVGDLVAKLHLDIADFMAKLAVARGELSLLKGGMNDSTGAVRDGERAWQDFGMVMGDANMVLADSATGFGALGTSLVALPALFVAVTVVAIALTDVLGSLIAVVADLVAPLTLLVGLLGGLGAAFIIGAKRAAEGGGKLSEFQKAVSALGTEFKRTSDILAHVFLPYLLQLASAANTALSFIDRIAKMPLKEAFRTIASQGTELLTRFVNAVADVLAHPIRLAFKIAFSAGPFQDMVASFWHRFTGFLFGYTQTHQAHIGRFLGPMTKSQVDGIFQPLIDWFNKHHFEKQGQQIGHEILAGVTGSDAAGRVAHLFISAFEDALKIVGMGIFHLFQNSGRWAMEFTIAAANAIKKGLGAAWDWVKAKALGVWHAIVSAVESVLTVNISWPSPPGWVSSLFGLGGSTLPTSNPQGWHGGVNQGSSSLSTSGGGGGHNTAHGSIVLHVDGRVLASATLNHMRQMQRQGTRLGLNVS